MLKATLRGLVAHRLRLALAGLAVVLGVAFVAGTLVLSDTLTTTFDDLFRTISANVDVSVRGVATGTDRGQSEHAPVPAAAVDTIRRVDGVKEAFGYLQRVGVALVDPAGKAITTGGAPTLGLLWDPYPDLASLHLRDGRPPHGDGEVVIDAHTADSHGIHAGDRLTASLPVGMPRAFTVSGIARFGDKDNLAGAILVAFDAQPGRALLGAADEYDGVSVKAQPGVTAQTLTARVAAALPPGVEAVTGQTVAQEQSDAVKTNLSFLSTFLLVFALISVFVGSFIILNTFSIIITQRQRELALLRAMGATRGQVLRSVLLEAALVGAIASALGVALGILIAKGLEALLTAVGLDLSGSSLQVRPRTVVVGLLLGTLVTVLASVVPARRATRVSPVEALRDASPSPTALSARRVVTGALLAGAGALLIALGLFVVSSSNLLVTGAGVLLTFVGIAVLAPVAVPPLVAVIGSPLRALAGVPGSLARENARRNPRRTASTASALMIGVGLVSTFTVVAASLKDSINGVVDRTVTADYVVVPDTFGGDGLSPAVADAVRAASGVATVSEISAGTFHHGAQGDQVIAVDPATFDEVGILDVRSGAPLHRLGDGDVAVSQDAATANHLSLGDTLPMQFRRAGARSQRVGTVYARNPLLGDYVVTLATWRAGNPQTLDVAVLVKGASGVSQDALRTTLNVATHSFPATKVQNNAEYKKSQGDQVDVLLNLLTALVVLAIVIALLGVVNTMALSIVERTRELGLVRALGMTRRQTRSMVRWETVIITVFGTLLGIVVGVCFGAALVHALASQGFDTIDIQPGRQLTYVVLAVVAGVLAAYLPARRAARVDMLRAIATE